MPNLIDIRRRIRSVKSTQQITKAMKMVAASKLRRSQERVIAARPYARTLAATLASVTGRIPPREDGAPAHPLLAQREEKKVVLVVVTGDKGLCGAFNTNVNRAAGAFVREKKKAGVEVSLVTLGRKATDFWKRRTVPVLESRPGLFQRFDYATAAEIARSLAARFTGGEVDAVYVVFNEFKSVISQIVGVKRLLPIELGELEASEGGTDYIFEPGPDVILGQAPPAARRVPALPRPPRVERGRERRADDGDGVGDEERGRDDRLAHPHLQPGAPGEDHEGAHRDRLRRRGVEMNEMLRGNPVPGFPRTPSAARGKREHGPAVPSHECSRPRRPQR